MELLSPVRHPAPARAVPPAAARRRDPLVLRDDRAVGRQQRRHEHLEPHRRATATTTWSTRTSGGRAALPRPALHVRDRHGRLRPRRRPVPPALDDPRAVRHARRHASCARCPCSGTTHGGGHCETLFEDVRVPARVPPRRGRRRVRDRAGPARPRPHPPLHARDRAWPSGRSSSCASGPSSACAFGKPLADQGVVQERIAESRASRSSRHACSRMKAAWLMDTVGNEGRALRDRGDQGGGGARRDHRDRPRDPGLRRLRACPTTGRSPRCTRTPARCTSSTAPTRCTRCRSPGASSARALRREDQNWCRAGHRWAA